MRAPGLRSARLWVAPLIGLVAGVALSAAALAGDAIVDWPAKPPLPLFGGSAATARTLLATIAGAVTTLLALVFTILTVIIQLATSQYSPRSLRTLYMDRRTHFTIVVFVATITYALVVLVPLGADSDPPGISAMLAVVLAVLAIVTFAIYANHIAHTVRVGRWSTASSARHER